MVFRLENDKNSVRAVASKRAKYEVVEFEEKRHTTHAPGASMRTTAQRQRRENDEEPPSM